MAVSASYKALQREGLSNRVSLILETGEARDAHHMACLIGYNASGIYPYLALQTIKDLCDRNEIAVPYAAAVMHYKNALGRNIEDNRKNGNLDARTHTTALSSSTPYV